MRDREQAEVEATGTTDCTDAGRSKWGTRRENAQRNHPRVRDKFVGGFPHTHDGSPLAAAPTRSESKLLRHDYGSILEDKEGGGERGANDPGGHGVRDHEGIERQQPSNPHRAPAPLLFAIDEGDKADATEKEAGQQVGT